MRCLKCDETMKGGDKAWRACPKCHFAMHVFPSPETKEGCRVPAGGWMCAPGEGMGTFWPWGALPIAKETPE